MSPTQMLIFGYPPWFVELFRPFALLPYRWAYCAWLVFSLTLYAAGLWLLFRSLLRESYRRTAFLLALSAPMFTLETWIGGTAFGHRFFAVVLFLCCFEKRWPLLAGLALGLATYKPSLVAIPAAMMLLGGCWRMLAGLSASSALHDSRVDRDRRCEWLLAVDSADACLQRFATSNESILRRTKYVDLNSFLYDAAGRKFGRTRHCDHRDVGSLPVSGVELVAFAQPRRMKCSAICGPPRSPGR